VGAIEFSESTYPEIINTTFLNCTARNRYKITRQPDSAVFYNCKFIHDENLPILGRRTEDQISSFFWHGGTFEECTFTNLSNLIMSGGYLVRETGNYLFSPFYESPFNLFGINFGGGMVTYRNGNLILRKNTFNLNSMTAGIGYLWSGTTYSDGPNYLLLDGNIINDTGGDSVLLALYNCACLDDDSHPNVFRTYGNNIYNGRVLERLDQWSDQERPRINVNPSNPTGDWSFIYSRFSGARLILLD